MPERLQERWLDCTEFTMVAAESYGTELARWSVSLHFWIGDLARYSESRWPDTHHQVWPEWVSPGMLARCKAVAKAYPKPEDRQHDATWTQYMKLANKPNRQELLAQIVEEGLTTDESAKVGTDAGQRWLLAVDVHYYVHRFWYSGAGVETAVGVASWIQRTVERLRQKGLTDVACCFDSPRNDRKELTRDWDDPYKDRPAKDLELGNQLKLVRELLAGHGFCCASVDGWEADDVLASYAKQFEGRVTLLTQDKDARQCLSDKCNILLDVEWQQDETTGDMLPDYKWLSAKQHTEATGISPKQWPEFQSLMGDSVDGIRGAVGVGEKGAADLVKEFGSAAEAIQAAKDGAESIKPKKRKSLIEFEPKLDTTLQLVTLRTNLTVPQNTRV